MLNNVLLLVPLATLTSAYCYLGATSFENAQFQPDYAITPGGVISHNMHFAGFNVVNDGTPFSPNTGINAGEDYPYFIAFNTANQGSSARYRPSMQVGRGFTSFSLRTMEMGCFEDTAGHDPNLPAVDCDITLTCYRGGQATASQTVEYTCGTNRDHCNGLSNGPLQPAELDVNKFACCQKVGFSATPRTSNGHPVAVGLDVFSYYVRTRAPVGGQASYPESVCGC